MKLLAYLFLTSFLLSQSTFQSKNDLTNLKLALENASRTGQKLFLEEFSGLT